MTTRSFHRRRAARGYTVVEVMMALAVLTLGASGVLAMQRATLIANTNARNLATANGIAQSWVERLRADVLMWNEPGGTSDIAETAWIKSAATAAPVGGAGWFTPNATPYDGTTATGAPGNDVMGAELHAGDTTFVTAFCTQLRLTRFTGSKTAGLSQLYRAVRIEVRVMWDRQGSALDCTTLPAGWDMDPGRYGSVYVVSAATENASPY